MSQPACLGVRDVFFLNKNIQLMIPSWNEANEFTLHGSKRFQNSSILCLVDACVGIIKENIRMYPSSIEFNHDRLAVAS